MLAIAAENNSNLYETSDLIFFNSIITFYDISKWLNVILITFIAIFGLYGNIISIAIFSSDSYNKNSIKSLRIYLILLTTSDLLVLIFHYLDFTLRSWVNLTESYSARFNFVDKSTLGCKLVPYLRNLFRTISVFTLVLMTLQRFILINFPSMQARFCTIQFSKKVAIALIILASIFNTNVLFVNGLSKHNLNNESFCSTKQEYVTMQFNFDLLFVLFTILIPAMIIFVLGKVYFFLNPNIRV